MFQFKSAEEIFNLLNQYPFLAVGLAVGLGLISTSVCPFTIPARLGIVGYASAKNSTTDEKNTKLKSLQIASFFFAGIVASFLLLGLRHWTRYAIFATGNIRE